MIGWVFSFSVWSQAFSKIGLLFLPFVCFALSWYLYLCSLPVPLVLCATFLSASSTIVGTVSTKAGLHLAATLTFYTYFSHTHFFKIHRHTKMNNLDNKAIRKKLKNWKFAIQSRKVWNRNWQMESMRDNSILPHHSKTRVNTRNSRLTASDCGALFLSSSSWVSQSS